MPTVLAIDISETQAVVVAADRGDDEGLELLQVRSYSLAELEQLLRPENGAQSSGAQSSTAADLGAAEEDDRPAATNGHRNERLELETLLGIEADSTVAVISGRNVLYRNISLPFNNPKKVEQVAPLQVQDYVPFDIEDFLLDYHVVGRDGDGNFEILTSLVPQSDVAETLARLSSLGVDPKLLSTKASALSALVRLAGEPTDGSFAVLSYSEGRCALAQFVDGQLRRLRELPLLVEKNFGQEQYLFKPQFIADLNASLIRAEQDYGARFDRVYVVGPALFRKRCAESLNVPIQSLDLSRVVRVRQDRGRGEILPEDLDELSWAVGLAAHELLLPKAEAEHLVDFRKGEFAYKPAWRNFWSALQPQMFPILLAVFFGIGWYLSVVYKASADLEAVESRISEAVRAALPGERVPPRREVSFLQDRVGELEDQLRSIGSLSSLSPLESLKELSTAITPDIDVDIEAINISQSGISFRGSVSDPPMSGRLESALERNSNRFCDLKLDLKGRIGSAAQNSGGRVKFSADMRACSDSAESIPEEGV